jgi:hypothetical protein
MFAINITVLSCQCLVSAQVLFRLSHKGHWDRPVANPCRVMPLLRLCEMAIQGLTVMGFDLSGSLTNIVYLLYVMLFSANKYSFLSFYVYFDASFGSHILTVAPVKCWYRCGYYRLCR